MSADIILDCQLQGQKLERVSLQKEDERGSSLGLTSSWQKCTAQSMTKRAMKFRQGSYERRPTTARWSVAERHLERFIEISRCTENTRYSLVFPFLPSTKIVIKKFDYSVQSSRCNFKTSSLV